MLVPMTFVRGVTVPVVDVIDMVLVRHCDVATTRTMGVIVAHVLSVTLGDALVEVPVVLSVEVPVMDVVDMVPVRHCDVPTALPMHVRMIGVSRVGRCHWRTSKECRMASLTM
jgi:hypothetical protein